MKLNKRLQAIKRLAEDVRQYANDTKEQSARLSRLLERAEEELATARSEMEKLETD